MRWRSAHPFLTGDESLEEVWMIVTTMELDYPHLLRTNLHDIIERVSTVYTELLHLLRDKVLSRLHIS